MVVTIESVTSCFCLSLYNNLLKITAMKKCLLILFQGVLVALAVLSCKPSVKEKHPQTDSMITISKQQLKDKIKGGKANSITLNIYNIF